MVQKLVPLEALRGIAALIVVVHHVLLGFAPGLKQPFPVGLVGTPLNWAVNGSAAVEVFFVLSGYVLTRRFYAQPGLSADLFWAAAKRLPRLAPPVGMSILLGYAILALGLNHNVAAAAISQSPWLNDFGWANFPDGFEPKLKTALAQCFWVFVRPWSSYYNSSLWTMRGEFLGSLFCFAYLLVHAPLRRWRWGLMAVNLGLVILAPKIESFVLPFFLGSLLAQYLPQGGLRLPLWPGLGLLAASLALCSSEDLAVMIWGAAGLLFCVLNCEALARPLSGRLGRALGAISFPVYLVHLFVICTTSSALYIWLAEIGLGHNGRLLVMFPATFAVSLLAAEPFRWLDGWWVPSLNAVVRRLQTRSVAVMTAARQPVERS